MNGYIFIYILIGIFCTYYFGYFIVAGLIKCKKKVKEKK